MVYARNAGDGITFREVYKSSFDGSTFFSYKNSFLSNTNQFSLYLNIIPTVTSARQVMFSFGDLSSNTVLFEVGISTNNKAFFYDGTTETEVDLELVSGTNYNIEYVFNNSSVTIYINDITVNVGFSNDLNSNDVIIGASIDGTGDYYSGYLNDVNVFSNSHNYKDVSVITGGNYAYTPADDLGANGVWYSLTESGLLVKNTQPVVANAGFETGDPPTGWTAIDSSLSAVAPATGSSGVAACRITATGATFWAQQYLLIVGNQYHVAGKGRSDGTAAPTVLMGSPANNAWLGAASTAWQSFDSAIDAVGSDTLFIGSLDAAGWAEFDDITLSNLSVTTATPKAATGALVGANLVQASDAAMGWEDDGLFFAAGDGMPIDGSLTNQRLFHNSTSMFVSTVVSIATLGIGVVFSSSSGAAQTGAQLYTDGSGILNYFVDNGTGTHVYLATSSAGAMTTGEHLITATKQASGITIRVDGVEVATDTTIAGSFSAGDASSALKFGNAGDSYSYGLQGAEKEIVVSSDLTALSRVETFLAAKHGITLP